MSVVWLFVIVYALAWALGLRVLRGLRRRSNMVVTLFTGGVFGALNYLLGGAVHDQLYADTPTISLLLVFGLRTIGHSLALIGFQDRGRGRGARQKRHWRVLFIGGLYFAAVGLGVEGIVQVSAYWEGSDLAFELDRLRDLVPTG